jgi:hypothetical protein
MPVIHWVSEKIKLVASEYDAANEIWFLCTFRNEPRWSYHGQPLMVGGLKFHFTCKKDYVAQTVRTDVSLGYYSHLKNSDRHGFGGVADRYPPREAETSRFWSQSSW